jgi:hypothetical protein
MDDAPGDTFDWHSPPEMLIWCKPLASLMVPKSKQRSRLHRAYSRSHRNKEPLTYEDLAELKQKPSLILDELTVRGPWQPFVPAFNSEAMICPIAFSCPHLLYL